MKSFNLFRGRVLIGLFSHWIGVGTRTVGPYRTFSAGFIHLMLDTE